MDLLTRKDIAELARYEREGRSVTIFLPTDRRGQETSGDPLLLKNLLGLAEHALADGGMRRLDVEELLRPARELQHDAMAWSHMSDGLAIFLGPGGATMYRVPLPLPALVTVGDHFVISPLLRLLGGREHHLVLALSQERIRLLEGGRTVVEEIELDDVPTALRDVIEPFDPRSDTITRSLGAARGGTAVFFGHGTGGGDLKNKEMTGFLRQVSEGVGEVLHDRDLPMVLAGLPQTIAAYREVNSYSHVLDQTIEHNPDDLSDAELHEHSWAIIAGLRDQSREESLGRLRGLLGTGQASTDLAEIEEAAGHGRIAELLVADIERTWDPTEPMLARLGTDEEHGDVELIDRVARATLTASGEVTVVDGAALPEGIAAIMRY